MTGNSSDDNESDSDNSFGSTKIKPEWMELQNNQQFYIDEWPNRLPSEKQPEPNIENIVQLLRKQSRARSSVQNGCNEKENAQGSAPNISQQEFDRISSTVNTDDLMEIIGCVNGPSQPALNPNQQPPPPPLPPPTMPAQLHPRPPPPTMPTQLLPRPPPHPHTQSSNMTNVVSTNLNLCFDTKKDLNLKMELLFFKGATTFQHKSATAAVAATVILPNEWGSNKCCCGQWCSNEWCSDEWHSDGHNTLCTPKHCTIH